MFHVSKIMRINEPNISSFSGDTFIMMLIRQEMKATSISERAVNEIL